jgi:hypothetical protein
LKTGLLKTGLLKTSGIRQHTPAYVSIRQHTPAYVSKSGVLKSGLESGVLRWRRAALESGKKEKNVKKKKMCSLAACCDGGDAARRHREDRLLKLETRGQIDRLLGRLFNWRRVTLSC